MKPSCGNLIEYVAGPPAATTSGDEPDAYGCGQIIWWLPSRAYVAGSDDRGDGQAAGY